MKFKAKLRRIGNSQGIYIPKNVITSYEIGDELELEVITLSGKKVITSDNKNNNVITSEVKNNNIITPKRAKKFNSEWCNKHGTYKGSCGCK